MPKVERARVPLLRHVLFPTVFYFSAHWPNALTAKFKNPTLEKVNPAPTTGGRVLEALSNFSVFVFDFTSYQFVTPPAVLRAYEFASEW